jgi:hypothetical protein
MIRHAIVIVTEAAARALAAVAHRLLKASTLLINAAFWLRRVGRGE